MDASQKKLRSRFIELGLHRWIVALRPVRWRAPFVLPAVAVFFLFPLRSFAQDRSADESSFRGNRAEVSVTIKDNSGSVITTPATVRIYHSGILSGQAAASKGRAF
jgi:hypothetical protein